MKEGVYKSSDGQEFLLIAVASHVVNGENLVICEHISTGKNVAIPESMFLQTIVDPYTGRQTKRFEYTKSVDDYVQDLENGDSFLAGFAFD